jgi:hypothetical protein
MQLSGFCLLGLSKLPVLKTKKSNASSFLTKNQKKNSSYRFEVEIFGGFMNNAG